MSGDSRSPFEHSSLIPEDRATSNLLVADTQGVLDLIGLLRNAPEAFALRSSIFYLPGSPAPQGFTTQMETFGVAVLEPCASVAELMSKLAEALEAATMGTRLYVAGAQGFAGRVHALAHRYGMGGSSIQTKLSGSTSRRVRCVHCKHISESVTTNVIPCGGCGLLLFVRDHYSQRLAAFMGVAVNAEDAASRPAVREVYP